MTHHHRDVQRVKTLLAQECARLMADEGVPNFRTAKRKAAVRLAVANKALLPDNREIEQALMDHQRLFHADQQASRLQDLRKTALDAMRFLARFRPRLVGPVLSGTAGLSADIQLHLFADAPHDVALFLMEHQIFCSVGHQLIEIRIIFRQLVSAFYFFSHFDCHFILNLHEFHERPLIELFRFFPD